MTNEEIWMHYFAAAFAGRQGPFKRAWIEDYSHHADFALWVHRKRWPKVEEKTVTRNADLRAKLKELENKK